MHISSKLMLALAIMVTLSGCAAGTWDDEIERVAVDWSAEPLPAVRWESSTPTTRFREATCEESFALYPPEVSAYLESRGEHCFHPEAEPSLPWSVQRDRLSS